MRPSQEFSLYRLNLLIFLSFFVIEVPPFKGADISSIEANYFSVEETALYEFMDAFLDINGLLGTFVETT